MRKLFLFNFVTLDGFVAGPHQEIDWLVLVVARSEYALNLGLHMVYDDYWKMSIGKSLVIPTPVA